MHNTESDTPTLMSGHYLGLKFNEGWWFVHILETELVELKPWTAINENGNRGPIAAQTAGSEDEEVQDALGRHLLQPEASERNLIFQVLTGVTPSRSMAFPIFGRNRAPNLEDLEPGHPEVWFSGYDSPYNNPSDQSELFVVNNEPDVSVQAYNPMDEPTEVKYSFHVNKLRYATVTDKNLMKAILQGQQTAKLHPMGLGSQNNEQIETPGWVNQTFGEHIHTTEEILSSDGGSGGQSQSNDSVIPGDRGNLS